MSDEVFSISRIVGLTPPSGGASTNIVGIIGYANVPGVTIEEAQTHTNLSTIRTTYGSLRDLGSGEWIGDSSIYAAASEINDAAVGTSPTYVIIVHDSTEITTLSSAQQSVGSGSVGTAGELNSGDWSFTFNGTQVPAGSQVVKGSVKITRDIDEGGEVYLKEGTNFIVDYSNNVIYFDRYWEAYSSPNGDRYRIYFNIADSSDMANSFTKIQEEEVNIEVMAYIFDGTIGAAFKNHLVACAAANRKRFGPFVGLYNNSADTITDAATMGSEFIGMMGNSCGYQGTRTPGVATELTDMEQTWLTFTDEASRYAGYLAKFPVNDHRHYQYFANSNHYIKWTDAQRAAMKAARVNYLVVSRGQITPQFMHAQCNDTTGAVQYIDYVRTSIFIEDDLRILVASPNIIGRYKLNVSDLRKLKNAISNRIYSYYNRKLILNPALTLSIYKTAHVDIPLLNILERGIKTQEEQNIFDTALSTRNVEITASFILNRPIHSVDLTYTLY
jgi:hypothetical protein